MSYVVVGIDLCQMHGCGSKHIKITLNEWIFFA